MEVFQEEQQKLIANLLVERNVDVMKAVEESRKRDAERDSRRHAAEEARNFELEQRELRRNILNFKHLDLGANEFEKVLKVEGD